MKNKASFGYIRFFFSFCLGTHCKNSKIIFDELSGIWDDQHTYFWCRNFIFNRRKRHSLWRQNTQDQLSWRSEDWDHCCWLWKDLKKSVSGIFIWQEHELPLRHCLEYHQEGMPRLPWMHTLRKYQWVWQSVPFYHRIFDGMWISFVVNTNISCK